MSTAALEAKKQQVSDYFTYHPDSQEISIVGSEDTFLGMFDHAYKDGYKDGGNVNGQKKEPHITFFGDYESLFTPRTTQVIVSDRTFTVMQKRYDETDGTFQGEIWLV